MRKVESGLKLAGAVALASLGRIRLAALLCLSLLFMPAAWAVGTASGITIASTATVSFALGGVDQLPVTQVVSFVVDNKVNLTVVEMGGGATVAVAGSLLPVQSSATFSVNNHGNTSQDFALSVGNLGNGVANPFGAALQDNYDGGSCTIGNIAQLSGVMGAYTAGDQHINALAADSSATVTVNCTIPAAQVTNNLAVISLTATARADDGANTLGAVLVDDMTPDQVNTVQVVFMDGNGSDDVARDATHSARDAYLIGNALLNISKTIQDVTDPKGTVVTNPASGEPSLVPGALMTYRIAVSMTGTGAVTNLVINDPLPGNVSYETGSISVTCVSGNFTAAGACGTGVIATAQAVAVKTDNAADTDFASFDATTKTVSVSLGDVAAPANVVITFRATID